MLKGQQAYNSKIYLSFSNMFVNNSFRSNVFSFAGTTIAHLFSELAFLSDLHIKFMHTYNDTLIVQ